MSSSWAPPLPPSSATSGSGSPLSSFTSAYGILFRIPGARRFMLSAYLARFGAAMMGVSIIASNWLPTYFQAVKGEGATTSGVHVLPGILSAMLFVVVVGAASK